MVSFSESFADWHARCTLIEQLLKSKDKHFNHDQKCLNISHKKSYKYVICSIKNPNYLQVFGYDPNVCSDPKLYLPLCIGKL